MSIKLPVVAVIGTTGAGKSRVGVDIALACNGEVINADAMQVYRGLDIITNKVTVEEMRGVPHHLMGYKNPGEDTYVAEWVRMASDSIDAIHARNRLPVIVGGTSYWLQSLLFTNQLIVDGSSSEDVNVTSVTPSTNLQAALDRLSSEDLALFRNLPDEPPKTSIESEETLRLWKLLEQLDPEMAARWHWKDSRKVLRSLEIIGEKGERASDVIKDQDKEAPESRYRILVIWPHTEKQVLNPRLDKRVDQMIDGGLLNEIQELNQIATNIIRDTGSSIDYTRGIFQSIGFKEFHEYLVTPSDSLFKSSVDSMKRATQKYATYQTKWIRRKFLPILQALSDAHIYVLDTTNVDEWSRLERQAIDVTEAFLSNKPLPPQPEDTRQASLLSAALPLSKPSAALLTNKRVPCEICTRVPNEPFLVMADEWTIHLNSRGHRQRIKSRKKREHNLEYLRQKSQETDLLSSDEADKDVPNDDSHPTDEPVIKDKLER